MTINERLKLLRTENELTQTQLAQELNIAQTTIASYERDHDPNIYNLVAYAKYFKCSLEFLTGIEDEIYGDRVMFSEPERAVIRAFRKLTPDAKKFVKVLMEALAKSELSEE